MMKPRLTFMAAALLGFCMAANGQNLVYSDSVTIAVPDSLHSRKLLDKQSDTLELKSDSLTFKREFEYSDEYLDTVKINRKFTINDYSIDRKSVV